MELPISLLHSLLLGPAGAGETPGFNTGPRGNLSQVCGAPAPYSYLLQRPQLSLASRLALMGSFPAATTASYSCDSSMWDLHLPASCLSLSINHLLGAGHPGPGLMARTVGCTLPERAGSWPPFL